MFPTCRPLVESVRFTRLDTPLELSLSRYPMLHFSVSKLAIVFTRTVCFVYILVSLTLVSALVISLAALVHADLTANCLIYLSITYRTSPRHNITWTHAMSRYLSVFTRLKTFDCWRALFEFLSSPQFCCCYHLLRKSYPVCESVGCFLSFLDIKRSP